MHTPVVKICISIPLFLMGVIAMATGYYFIEMWGGTEISLVS